MDKVSKKQKLIVNSFSAMDVVGWIRFTAWERQDIISADNKAKIPFINLDMFIKYTDSWDI